MKKRIVIILSAFILCAVAFAQNNTTLTPAQMDSLHRAFADELANPENWEEYEVQKPLSPWPKKEDLNTKIESAKDQAKEQQRTPPPAADGQPKSGSLTGRVGSNEEVVEKYVPLDLSGLPPAPIFASETRVSNYNFKNVGFNSFDFTNEKAAKLGAPIAAALHQWLSIGDLPSQNMVEYKNCIVPVFFNIWEDFFKDKLTAFRATGTPYDMILDKPVKSDARPVYLETLSENDAKNFYLQTQLFGKGVTGVCNHFAAGRYTFSSAQMEIENRSMKYKLYLATLKK